MTRSRVKFNWYGGVAFFVALLLTGLPSQSEADAVTRQDIPSQTESSSPALRLHLSDDVLRRIDRTWFEPIEPQDFALFHTVLEFAPSNRALRPAASTSRTLQARAPPTRR